MKKLRRLVTLMPLPLHWNVGKCALETGSYPDMLPTCESRKLQEFPAPRKQLLQQTKAPANTIQELAGKMEDVVSSCQHYVHGVGFRDFKE